MCLRQISILTESFRTSCTLVRFLTCVSSHVSRQMSIITETLRANCTHERFHLCVYLYVSCQGFFPTKSFEASYTLEEFVIRLFWVLIRSMLFKLIIIAFFLHVQVCPM